MTFSIEAVVYHCQTIDLNVLYMYSFVMIGNTAQHWKRAIILVDMNAFFASIEQQDNPMLRNKPVAVTNGEHGSCIITASYEARAFGIKTGMRFLEAQQQCPALIRCSSRPARYAERSKQLMTALTAITPDIEVFSVDEAFLDISHCQMLHGHPADIARKTYDLVWQAVQLPCSVGLSGDKTTAKFAAKCKKPNGITIIPPWLAEQRLRHVLVTELCGIGPGIAHFLKQHGVLYCGDIRKIPISVLAQRYGNLGRRIWYMCQGLDPEPIKTVEKRQKTMGHGKVLPPNTNNIQTIATYFCHMSEKLACRLRRHHMVAQTFFIGVRLPNGQWIEQKLKTAQPTNHGKMIFQLSKILCDVLHNHTPTIRQVQVTALDLMPANQQQDLFYDQQINEFKRDCTIDNINERFGEFKLSPARLLHRTSQPNVIGPCQRK